MNVQPDQNVISVTPSDSQDLSMQALMLFVGGGGDVRLTTAATSSPVVFKNVPSGSFLAVRAKRVYATGTTATDIVAIC